MTNHHGLRIGLLYALSAQGMWFVGGGAGSVVSDWLFCEVLSGMGERCPPESFAGILRYLLVDDMPYSLALASGQLLLALPATFLFAERGLIFATALGACAGAQLAFFSAYSGWAHASGLGFESSVVRFCGAVDSLCTDALMLPYLLLWFAYWTLLPALFAAGLLRLGRMLIGQIRRSGEKAAD